MENKITAAEKAYNEMADENINALEIAVENHDALGIMRGFDYSRFDGSREETITQDFCAQNPVATFSGAAIKNSALMGAVMSGQPLCVETNLGRVVFMHGNPDGTVLTSQGVAHYTSRAFEKDLAPYIDGQDHVFLVSCYPGSRPPQWMIGSTKIINLGGQLRPLTAVVKDGKLLVSYISRHYQELAETKLLALMEKIATMFGQR